MQLLCNRYFEVLVDHKAIEYMINSKTESPTTKLKTLLLKLSKYTIDLKYQKGSEMHTSDALSRLQNIADTPNNKNVILQNFLQHLTPNYIEHAYSHLVRYSHTVRDIMAHHRLYHSHITYNCPECHKTLPTPILLCFHSYYHRQKRFKCTDCNQNFVYQSKLKQH